jgi:hypothetical protein
MLVATRDHEPRPNGRHLPPAAALGHAVPPRSRLSHVTNALQLIGSLIGIPLALASGYSVYRANFSAEASCQSLRANIVTMLDKNADASTLRSLVHRDIVNFERDCGAVDPDAVAAFKNLLTAERTPPTRRVEAPRKSDTAKPETVKSETVKPERVVNLDPPAKLEAAPKVEAPAKVEAAAKTEPPVAMPAAATPKKVEAAAPAKTDREKLPEVANERAEVDAKWLAAVRQALQDSATRPQAAEPVAESAPAMPPPVVVPALVQSAPARKPDHPVPPGSIPNPGAQ